MVSGVTVNGYCTRSFRVGVGDIPEKVSSVLFALREFNYVLASHT